MVVWAREKRWRGMQQGSGSNWKSRKTHWQNMVHVTAEEGKALARKRQH